MSWKIKEKYRKTLAGETGAVSKDRGGKLTVCLVYPNIVLRCHEQSRLPGGLCTV